MAHNVKCPKCGFMKTVSVSTLQWQCPTCRHWLAIKTGRPIKAKE